MTGRARDGWLNRNVVTISAADLLADANYEMTLAVLPLFLVIGLGASTVALGVVEGVGDACLAVAVFVSGLRSDRLPRRRWLAAGGYLTTVAGLATLVVAGQWVQVVGSRAVAWIGRGVRKPIRSAMLAGSVERSDLGKAFGLHEALDTLGALIGPGVAFLLLATGHGFQTVFLVAVVPGVLSVLVFAGLTRDPQTPSARPRPRRQAMPGAFWRLIGAVGTFGLGNFAVAFLILRALDMLRPELSTASATATAVAFFLGVNAAGAAASFPGGWLVDRVGGRGVLTTGYALFAIACLVAAGGHGAVAVALVAIAAGGSAALVSLTESSYVASLVDAEHRGTAFGIASAVAGVGDLVSSVAVGAIWATVGAVPALAYGAILALSGAVLLVALRPATSPGSGLVVASAAAGTAGHPAAHAEDEHRHRDHQEDEDHDLEEAAPAVGVDMEDALDPVHGPSPCSHGPSLESTSALPTLPSDRGPIGPTARSLSLAEAGSGWRV